MLDNAGCRRSGKVAEFVGSCHSDIMPAYLPPYTPEPSPIETQRRMMRKATADRLYDTTKAMRDSIWAMMASGGPGVARMSHYLS